MNFELDGTQITIGENGSKCAWCLEEHAFLYILRKESGAKICVCENCKDKLLNGDTYRELRTKDWVKIINPKNEMFNEIGEVENIEDNIVHVSFIGGASDFNKSEIELI